MNTEEGLKALLENVIRPRARMDGGDLVFEAFEEGSLTIGAYGECATCLCCKERMQEWLVRECYDKLNISLRVTIKSYIPYYKR